MIARPAPAIYLVFFVSGVAALAYQVVWQRLLVIFSGSDVHSATVIVGAFMAGLGCGSLAGGYVADRVSPRLSFLFFAAAELAIGAFGIFSTDLYYGVLYRRLGYLALGREATATILFVSLLWPTFFMGMSLPLLARALTTRIEQAANVTGALYGWNTLGAAAGAFWTTWWLLPRHGLEGSVRTAAMLNFLAAATVVLLPLTRQIRDDRRDRGANERTEVTLSSRPGMSAPTIGFTFVTWMLISGLAGYVALSLEIVWFRLLGVMLKATALTFGTLLSVYLAGLGLGAAAGTRLVRRSRRPAHTFLALQASVGVYTAISLAILLALADARLAPWLPTYFERYDPLDVPAEMLALRGFIRGSVGMPREFLLLYFGLPALLVGPPTMLMGASFPLLQKAVQTEVRRVGSRVGALFVANIAGSVLGSIMTGWLCLTLFGTDGTLKLLVGASFVFALLGFTVSSRTVRPILRYCGYGAIVVTGASLVASMPNARTLWSRLHGARPASILFGEDGSGTSVLKATPGPQNRVTVFVNGLGQSWIPYGGIHTTLGALPAFIHANPRQAAVIGLGSGDTLFGVAGRQELERITCVEIIQPQLGTLRQLSLQRAYPGLLTILHDPRIEHINGDGRIHVMRGERKYDLIEADALRPTSAYAGLLYSDAFFELLRDRLNPGGLAVSWSPTERVHNTFLKVFPHVLSYGQIVLGSNEPIAFDAQAVRGRLSDPTVVGYYAQSGIDIRALLAPFLDQTPRVFGPAYDRSRLQDINTDLFPRDEFNLSVGGGQ